MGKADLNTLPRPAHLIWDTESENCVLLGIYLYIEGGVNIRNHVLEMIFLCTCNRCVVYKSVTKSQAELVKPPAPFQPTANSSCVVPVSVKVWGL